MSSNKIKTGDVFQTNEGGSVVVVEYINHMKVLVEHSDEYAHRATVRSCHLRNGQLKNPYKKHAYGFGFIGDGNYTSRSGGERAPAYESWKGILTRAYCEKFHKKHPSYLGVTVCDEWLNFQVFASWWNKEPNSGRVDFHLDKDLRIGGNKEYSPRACSFVPASINALIAGCDNACGSLPQGVRTRGKAFQAALRVKGKSVYLGTYGTPEQAFKAYQSAKEQHVRLMAQEWKQHLRTEVYEYLVGWRLSKEDAAHGK